MLPVLGSWCATFRSATQTDFARTTSSTKANKYKPRLSMTIGRPDFGKNIKIVKIPSLFIKMSSYIIRENCLALGLSWGTGACAQGSDRNTKLLYQGKLSCEILH